MNNKNFKRVFVHELGHLVAHILNKEHFEGTGVESIKLERKKINGGYDYVGITKPLKPEGYIDDKKVINLPEYIASIVYGCLFQSLYLTQRFTDCFYCVDSNKNGYCDAQSFIGALAQFGVSTDTRLILYNYIQEYFNTLVRSEFELVFKLESKNYIIEEKQNEYLFDVVVIEKDLSDFLSLHKDNYIEFMNRIKEILNWDEIKTQTKN